MTINDLDPQEVLVSTGVDANPLKIPNGSSASQAFDMKGFRLKGLLTPAAWTAASLTFQASFDGVTFFPWFQASATQSGVSGASIPISGYLTPNLTAGGNEGPTYPRFLKLQSGTVAAPVTQGADRLFSVVLEPNPYRVQV